jgi:hypothetical protein
MNANAYIKMKELAKIIHEKIDLLESGKLNPHEVSKLLDECRDLYERMVILQYKTVENNLSETSNIQEERVIEGFKLDLTDIGNNHQKEKPSVIKENETQQMTLMQVIEQQKKDNIEKEHKTIHEKLAANFQNSTSINDKLAEIKSTKTSLAEQLQKKPISDLKSAIGLNQKFLFMNDLFEGENSKYNQAIDKLNSFSNIDEAKNYLLTLGNEYNWDLYSTSVQELTDLVERRYA